MIEVRTTRGETHRGKSPTTIARRLYGRRAWVRVGSTANVGIDGYAEASVLTPVPGEINVGNVEATWLLDRVALDAFADELEVDEPCRQESHGADTPCVLPDGHPGGCLR